MDELAHIDLADELICYHLVEDGIFTVRNMDSLIEWLKTQIPDGQRWQDVEMTGVAVGEFYALVKAASRD